MKDGNFKKTIFIPLYSGQAARNILRTDVFKELRRDSRLRIVIFVHPKKMEFYQKGFMYPNVFFELLPAIKKTIKLDFLFYRLAFWMVDSESTKVRNYRDRRRNNENFFYYCLKRFFIKFIGNIFLFKQIFRYFDIKLIKTNLFRHYFDKYNPDLVFCPNVFDRYDLILLREAKYKKISTIGMIRSWDNLSNRGLLRVIPGHMIVHNEHMKRETLKWVTRNEKRITVCGMPHFDYYLNYYPDCEKEEFYKRFNISSDKRIIIFSPLPESYGTPYWEILKKLDQAINAGRLSSDVIVLVRFMPGDNVNIEEFKIKHFNTPPNNLVFDSPGKHFLRQEEKIDWDFSDEDMKHLANSLYFSSLVINYASTLNIDAAAFNKPIINIAFDGNKGQDIYERSIKWIFDLTHNKQITQTNGTKLANSFDELVKYVNLYLNNASLDQAGRKRIISEQCWKHDGLAGKRVAECVLNKCGLI